MAIACVKDLALCAGEIIAVMEKHKITMSDMDVTLELVRETVYSNTHIQFERSEMGDEECG